MKLEDSSEDRQVSPQYQCWVPLQKHYSLYLFYRFFYLILFQIEETSSAQVESQPSHLHQDLQDSGGKRGHM